MIEDLKWFVIQTEFFLFDQFEDSQGCEDLGQTSTTE